MLPRLLPTLAALGLAVAARAAAPAPFDPGPWAPGVSPREVGARVAARFAATPFRDWQGERAWYPYAEVCTWYGALTFAALSGDAALAERLVARFDPCLQPATAGWMPPAGHVDASVFGAVPLEIHRQTRRVPYRLLGLAYADAQWDRPRPDGLSGETRFWIDDMYMITALQVQAYRVTGDSRYLDRAAREMVAYLDRLQQPNGLFFHAPEARFHWGRGNGWMAAGMAELLRDLPAGHPQHAAILEAFRRMMAALLAAQAPDGSWRQLVDRPESWPESSCTGMFTFAFISGVRHGWLPAETYGPAARRGWLALVRFVDPQGDVREVCVGTGARDDYQYYLDRPRATGDLHGQAPLLWCASAWLR